MDEMLDALCAFTDALLTEEEPSEQTAPEDPGSILEGTGTPTGAAARPPSRLKTPAYGAGESLRQITGNVLWDGATATIDWSPVTPRYRESYWLKITPRSATARDQAGIAAPRPIWILLGTLRGANEVPRPKEFAYKDFGIDPDVHQLSTRLHVERSDGEAV